MKHTLIVDDTTEQGKQILDFIKDLHPSEIAVEFLGEDEQELFPAEEVFAEFKERLVSEVGRKHGNK